MTIRVPPPSPGAGVFRAPVSPLIESFPFVLGGRGTPPSAREGFPFPPGPPSLPQRAFIRGKSRDTGAPPLRGCGVCTAYLFVYAEIIGEICIGRPWATKGLTGIDSRARGSPFFKNNEQPQQFLPGPPARASASVPCGAGVGHVGAAALPEAAGGQGAPDVGDDAPFFGRPGRGQQFTGRGVGLEAVQDDM